MEVSIPPTFFTWEDMGLVQSPHKQADGYNEHGRDSPKDEIPQYAHLQSNDRLQHGRSSVKLSRSLCQGTTDIKLYWSSVDSPSNYRSIAIENPFLKTLTSLLRHRLFTFIESNSLLPEYQFGFRKNRSSINSQNGFKSHFSYLLESTDELIIELSFRSELSQPIFGSFIPIYGDIEEKKIQPAKDYLEYFDAVKKANEWDEERAACMLVPSLGIESRLLDEVTESVKAKYSTLKIALLAAGTLHRLARVGELKTCKIKFGETAQQFRSRVSKLVEQCYSGNRRELVLDNFIYGPMEMRTAVMLQKPKKIDEAITAAMMYVSMNHLPRPRESNNNVNKTTKERRIVCFKCNVEGHYANNCSVNKKTGSLRYDYQPGSNQEVIVSVSGHNIPCMGIKECTLVCGNKKIEHLFRIAPVDHGYLGADFLERMKKHGSWPPCNIGPKCHRTIKASIKNHTWAEPTSRWPLQFFEQIILTQAFHYKDQIDEVNYTKDTSIIESRKQDVVGVLPCDKGPTPEELIASVNDIIIRCNMFKEKMIGMKFDGASSSIKCLARLIKEDMYSNSQDFYEDLYALVGVSPKQVLLFENIQKDIKDKDVVILRHRNLSRMSWTTRGSVAEQAITCISKLYIRLKDLRSEKEFEHLYRKVEEFSGLTHSDDLNIVKKKRSKRSSMADFVVHSYIPMDETSMSEEKKLSADFYQAIDAACQALESRFDQGDLKFIMEIYQCCKCGKPSNGC
ncbi:hypothetical protein GQR58_011850 [Nymphon striatum]|nr:hypothetical protein GQR58_011850 [Nymphon striatum]